MTSKVSVAIITKNEEHNIRYCLESVRWADEVVVVDSGSTDATTDICREFGCRVFETSWLGFAKTKQFAVNQCTNEWVFVLDADEVVSERLQAAIPAIINHSGYNGFRIKRESFYLGKAIKYSGWNRDFTLRLFRKDKGRFNNKLVHESVFIHEGMIGEVRHPILHYTYPRVEVHIEKMVRYAKLGAEQRYADGKRSNFVRPMISGMFKFFKMFVLKAGMLDGKEGLILALNASFGEYLKYIFLWEKSRKNHDSHT